MILPLPNWLTWASKMGRFDLWEGAPTLRQLLKPGGCTIVLYPHFWYPVAPLDPLETRLWHYGARSSAGWETYTWGALQERWRAAGFSVKALSGTDFPPVHAASYVLELTRFVTTQAPRDMSFRASVASRGISAYNAGMTEAWRFLDSLQSLRSLRSLGMTVAE